MSKLFIYSAIFVFAGVFYSCGNNNSLTSTTTGWQYNFRARNAFSRSFASQPAIPPGMVAIEGWSFSVDDMEEYVTTGRRARQNDPNTRRTLSVNSFYMDEREIRNIDWREYLVWLNTVYGRVAPEIVEKARPNVNKWIEGLSENEPFLRNYFTHPSFNEYPVVSVSWEQAIEYCIWRTDRANELLLIRRGAIRAPDFELIGRLTTLEEIQEAVFSSARYFSSIQDNIAQTTSGLFYNFRLPTEDEWEFAAHARRKTDPEDKIRIYPWSETIYPRLTPKQRAQQNAQFNSGRDSNTNVFSRTVPAGHFAPNDFGLYNMAGNVNEWVFDQYSSRGNLNRIQPTDVLDLFLPEFHTNGDSRVYKGGSWKDPRYWLHPSTRRYLDRSASANDIGFRCAMSMIPGTKIR